MTNANANAANLPQYEVWTDKPYPVSCHHDATTAFIAGTELGGHFTLRLFTGRVIFDTKQARN